jgi:hypothetical protein
MFTPKAYTLLGDSKVSSHKFKLSTNAYSMKGSSYSALSHLTNTTSTRASSHDFLLLSPPHVIRIFRFILKGTGRGRLRERTIRSAFIHLKHFLRKVGLINCRNLRVFVIQIFHLFISVLMLFLFKMKKRFC